jgi:beta-phosphoglucomutase-like phosphatase (HAD superfamily)
MPIRCLVLDHDDTAVDSTRSIHHPAHLEAMARLRPGLPPVDLPTWYRKNFEPGITSFLRDELRMTDAELLAELEIWRGFTARGRPPFFPGFLETLAEFRACGGRVAVVSHSEAAIIRGHYQAAGDGAAFVPDLVFGWEEPAERRKPSPWPVQEIQRAYGLAPQELLVVDDLKPGVLMAKAAGVPVAAAGWSHDIPEIRAYMERECVAYFRSVAEFREYVLGDPWA